MKVARIFMSLYICFRVCSLKVVVKEFKVHIAQCNHLLDCSIRVVDVVSSAIYAMYVSCRTTLLALFMYVQS